ncbi:DHH family phosphoesterase [Halomicrobium katesii]|uniref:DHH family phosphoesterase n=1 Tax=Halomicrobium katesii TaxID=437163 RepID=UPI000365680F|nr:DHH family phosphoesterase [Halomicrobium katesii]
MADHTAVAGTLEGRDSCLLVVHAQADLDAVGAAVGLARTLDSDARIVAPDGLKRRARQLIEGLDETVHSPDGVALGDADCLVALDAPSSDRIEPVWGAVTPEPLVVIDHHEPGDLVEASTVAAVDTTAGATAALVADVIDALDGTADSKARIALAAGLFDDTGGLAGASPEEISRFGDLLADNDHVDVLSALLEHERSFGQRVAASKAVVRATGYRADRTLVLTTTISSQQSVAAQALRATGAEIALVFSERDDQCWIVGRAESESINLPEDLFEPLAETFDGDGGGHAGAGVAKLDTTALEAVREETLAQLEATLGTALSALS